MITKLRASKISIETPKEGAETWVHITVQKVLKREDGSIINVIPRFDYISFPIQEIGVNFYDVTEPLTGDDLSASGYGTASLIASIVTTTMIEKYGGSITPEGDVIL